MKTTLTDPFIKAIQPNGEDQGFWDERQPGLVLRCTPMGKLCWYVRATTHEGKRTRPKLGEWPTIGLSRARKEAMQMLADIQRGADPVASKRKARAERIEALTARTVAQALEEWPAARAVDPVKPWADTYQIRIRSVLRVHLPRKLAQRPLRDTKREDWTNVVVRAKRTAPGSAPFLYTIISSFLSHADAHGWIIGHPLPRKGKALIAPSHPPRERFLTDHEWLAVWHAADSENPKLRAFVRLVILSAGRVAEIAKLSLGEIRGDCAFIALPGVRTKNHEPHAIPLGHLARREIEAVWPLDQSDFNPDYKLLGRTGKTGFSGTGNLLERLHKRSGITDWSYHDLRRTARTTLTYLGVPEVEAESALNHVTDGPGSKRKLVRIYDKSSKIPLGVRALRAWQAYVADIVEGRREPGDAERLFRDGLPEIAMLFDVPTARPRIKMKPGPKPKGWVRPCDEEDQAA